MKKLIVLALAAMLAGCGSDPSTPTGTLPQVTGLTVVDSLCSGTTVFLSWNSVDSVTGYRIYYDESGMGFWDELQAVEDTFTTHDADRSYFYTILAFEGVDTSEDYADPVDTRPNDCGYYVIWDDHASADSVNAIVFGETTGITGRAEDTTFVHNAYAYDGGWAQSPVGLYSGAAGIWDNGNPTPLTRSNSGLVAPEGGYEDSVYVIDDDIIYCVTPDSHYVKVYVDTVEPDSLAADTSYCVRFWYQYQPVRGLRLFALL